jgi:hypothetical protein
MKLHTAHIMMSVYDFKQLAFKTHVRLKGEGRLSWRKRASIDPSLEIEIGNPQAEEVLTSQMSARITPNTLSRLPIHRIENTSVIGITTDETGCDLLVGGQVVNGRVKVHT